MFKLIVRGHTKGSTDTLHITQPHFCPLHPLRQRIDVLPSCCLSLCGEGLLRVITPINGNTSRGPTHGNSVLTDIPHDNAHSVQVSTGATNNFESKSPTLQRYHVYRCMQYLFECSVTRCREQLNILPREINGANFTLRNGLGLSTERARGNRRRRDLRNCQGTNLSMIRHGPVLFKAWV